MNPFYEESMNNAAFEISTRMTDSEKLNVAMKTLRNIHNLTDRKQGKQYSYDELWDLLEEIQGEVEWEYSMEDLGK